jgi:hypothetical protein
VAAHPLDQASGEIGGEGEVEGAADVSQSAARRLLGEGEGGDAEDDALERRRDRPRVGDVVTEAELTRLWRQRLQTLAAQSADGA